MTGSRGGDVTRAVVDDDSQAARAGRPERSEVRALRLIAAFVLGASAAYVGVRLGIPGVGLAAVFGLGLVAGVVAGGVGGLIALVAGGLVGLWLLALSRLVAVPGYWLIFLVVLVLLLDGFAIVWLVRRWRAHTRGTSLLDDPALLAVGLVVLALPYLFALLSLELTGALR